MYIRDTSWDGRIHTHVQRCLTYSKFDILDVIYFIYMNSFASALFC